MAGLILLNGFENTLKAFLHCAPVLSTHWLQNQSSPESAEHFLEPLHVLLTILFIGRIFCS